MGGFAAAVSVHQYMATAHIAKAGSEYLKEKYLKPAIAGEKTGALAISEPGAGSDVAAIRTNAKKEGNYYIINGSKIFITNGVYGDFITLACKTDADAGLGGISLIVIDRNSAGLSAMPLKKMGWHCSDTAELFFENVKVPVQNLIGEEGQGFYYIMDSFQLERLTAALLAVSGGEHALELTLQYINERKAFGKPIGRFQVIRHTLADLASELEAARYFTYHTAQLYDKGDFAVKECSMIKLLTAELSKKIADQCLQCFGGYGYMEEYPIARMYRDARVGTIVGGTSQIMREIIAKIMIDGTQYKPAYEDKNNKEKKETSKDKAVLKPENKNNDINTNKHLSNNNNTTTMSTEANAKEIILSLTDRFRPEKAEEGYETTMHFFIKGDRGGEFTVNIKDGKCTVEEGIQGEAKCVVKTKDRVYERIELGQTQGEIAVLTGRLKLSNMSEMMKFTRLFKRLF